ncbi:hypothetical protein GN958_ATG04742 [Phytophthora infestans]|uniref:Uncharacterized protein n=1 Tax=Phytophthora infestans TaxID=4787 RepID=A0A8S9UY77_PHYIN|nr:hypothetical protein GN958_ATG04742 [Phytophthora infestans]
MDPGIAAVVGQGNEPLDAPIEVAGRSGVGEGVTSVGNLPAKRRASEAEEQKTYTEEGSDLKQPEDGDEARRQDGADDRRRYGRNRPRPSEAEGASESIAGRTRSRSRRTPDS